MPRNQGDERRTIEELVLRYELHPELGDIYVEGSSDEAFIEWFLIQHERRDWHVYRIATVDVPSELVRARELDVNERGEVLTLGIELGERLMDIACRKPVCIADSDAIALDDSEISCELCLLTDFTSMEMYTYTTKALDKFLRLFIRTDRITAPELIQSFSPALVQLFVVRTVFHKSKWGIPVSHEFTRCCTKHGAEVQLDVHSLVTRSLQPTAQAHRPPVTTVVAEVAVFSSKIPGDARRAIRGHDFVQLLAWFLDGYGVPTEFRNVEVIRRALFASLEMNDLVEYPMFSELLSRTAA